MMSNDWEKLPEDAKIQHIKNDTFASSDERTKAYEYLCRLQQDDMKPGRIFASTSYAHVLYHIESLVPPKHHNTALDILAKAIEKTTHEALLHEQYGKIKMLFLYIRNNASSSNLKYPKTLLEHPIVKQVFAIDSLDMLNCIKQYDKKTPDKLKNAIPDTFGCYSRYLEKPFVSSEDIELFFQSTFEQYPNIRTLRDIVSNMQLNNTTVMLYAALREAYLCVEPANHESYALNESDYLG